MGSAGQGWLSTPAFELFRRGLNVQTITKFRGLNVHKPLTQLTPDIAQALLNVIVGSNGMLSKMRVPITLTKNIGIATGPSAFIDFQQQNGLRQVLATFGQQLYYYTNDLTNAVHIETSQLNAAQWNFVESGNILYGANGLRMQKWTGAAWQMWGIAGPAAAPTFVGAVAGNLSPLTGYQWEYAYKNSVTGHVGNASPASVSSGAGANQQYQVKAAPPTDPQDDTIVWFRPLDGGGTYFRLAEVVLNTGKVTFNAATVSVVAATGNLEIQDNTPDAALDQTIVAPTINNPPPQGKYLAVVQNRIFIAGIVGNASQVSYSGYEQILFGKPQESFPPFNSLVLNFGAEAVAGIGTLHQGAVFFSSTGKIYILRGAINDVVVSTPTPFSDTLEELPWTLGCLSHYSIRETPYGLIWLAGDKTVQFWSGYSPPIDISKAVYPLLRTITPGTELQCVGAYFNWLERDWYTLTCCTGGSMTPNTIIFWGLDIEQEKWDIFVSNIPANYIGVISTSQLQRKLLIGFGGLLSELPVKAVDTGGLTTDLVTYSPTQGILRAYWRSGYFGNDAPEQSKMYRWARLVVDSNAPSYGLTTTFVDDVNTVDAPYIQGPFPVDASRVALNRRAFRCAVEIDFDELDVPAQVLELQCAFIATSQR